MAYRALVFILCLCVLGDMIMTALRPTYKWNNAPLQLAVLGIHGFFVLAQAIMVFAFASRTVYFTAGLFGELFSTFRFSFFVWVLRLFMVQMPWTYRYHLATQQNDKECCENPFPWEDGAYAFLAAADVLLGLALWVAIFFTACSYSEKRMYSPYHKAGALSRENAGLSASAVVPPL